MKYKSGQKASEHMAPVQHVLYSPEKTFTNNYAIFHHNKSKPDADAWAM